MSTQQTIQAISIATFAFIATSAARAEQGDKPKKPQPPVVLLQDTPVGIIVRPDGSFAYFNRQDPSKDVVLKTSDGEAVKLRPRFRFRTAPKLPAQLLVLDRNGELHEVRMKLRGAGRKIAVDRFIDLWHRKTSGKQARWEESRLIWKGYTGAVMEYLQLRSGRIVVPFGKWIPLRPLAPPTGAHVVTAVYSDDGGRSWKESKSKLTSPCYKDYNGNNYGACEPAIVEGKDGHIYMLMRTQAGFLYESRSQDGTAWSKAVASRFHASTGPPGLLRLSDGRIVLFWNNCEMPPRINGQGVYGGRDALHAAISDDGGRTWRGFREVYRDPYRNKTPPKRGDRGTAYPYGSFDRDGNILLVAGQGRGRRNFIKIDPAWLTQTAQEDDFSNGLDAWHVFKPFGPAKGYWRDRTVGPRLVDHPSNPRAGGGAAKALHIRRPDDKDPDGAAWNFPLGWKGKLTLRLFLKKAFGGCSIALGDRLFEPTDDNGERLAIFRLGIDAQGNIGGKGKLELGRWHTLRLDWDLKTGRCKLLMNGVTIGQFNQRHPTGNGISYLRLRSTAKRVDPAGFLVDHVRADIDDPVAPQRSAAQNEAQENRYIKLLVGHRNKKSVNQSKASTIDLVK